MPDDHFASSQATGPETSPRAHGVQSTPGPQYPDFLTVALPLLRDPRLSAHFHGKDQLPEPSDDWEPMPDDPAARLRWQTLRKLTALLNERFRPVYATHRRHRRESALARQHEGLKRHDLLYERTMHIMEYHFGCLHTPCRRALARELEDNPHAFLELYSDLRAIAHRVERRLHARKSQSRAKGADDRDERLAAVTRRLRAGQGSDADLMEYLDCLGVGERLGE